MEQTIPTRGAARGALAESTHGRCEVVEVVDGLHRVSREATTVGFVLRVGRVHVSLAGPVYNTAIEVGQSIDFDEAVERVERA